MIRARRHHSGESSEEISYKDWDLIVRFDFSPGYPQTRHSPEEPAEIEINSMYIEETGDEVYDEVVQCEDDLIAIEELLWEKINEAKQEADEAC